MVLKILQLDPSLSFTENSQGRTALEVLAKKPFAVGSKLKTSHISSMGNLLLLLLVYLQPKLFLLVYVYIYIPTTRFYYVDQTLMT
jgi:hypothetical protein